MKDAKISWQTFMKNTFVVLLLCIIIFVSYFSFSFRKKATFAAAITVNISTPYDLYLFATRVNNNTSSGAYRSANVYLLNDIDMSNLSSSYTFSNIGYHPNYSFTGVFDGQNHAIKNLSIGGVNDRGLFGYVNGTVKNVVVYNGSVTANGGYSAGSIAGCLQGGTISNCYNMGMDVYISQSSSSTTGGIVGYVSAGSIVSCYNNAEVYTYSLSGDSVTIKSGGIAGHLSSGASISGCQNKGKVDAGSTNMYTYAGGIVGYCEGNITNCLNTGSVLAYAKVTNYNFTTINPLSSATSGSEYKASGQYDSISSVVPGNTDGSGYKKSTKYCYIGGIAGGQGGGTISYCINTNTTDYKSYGGYVHYQYDMYYLLYNYAQLNGKYYTYIYGHYYLYRNYFNSISGYKTGGTISNCYHPGKVTDRFSTWNGKIYYQHDGEQTEGSFSCSSIGDYENESFIDKKNYTSPQLLVIARRDTGITFTYAPHQKDNKTLYTISRPTNEVDWCLTTTGKTHIQSSTAMDTITNSNTTIWGYDGSTPKIKTFYWVDNAVKPS